MGGYGSALRLTAALTLAAVLAMLAALPAAAQWQGPPARTTIGGHFLGPAPSVTSIAGQHMPTILPSVTSIPNYWNQKPYYSPYRNGYYRGRGYGRGYSYGAGYAVPYYIPMDGGGYDYDYVGGPPLYSGPPVGNDSTLHIIVEQPPARAYTADPPEQAYAAPPSPQPAPHEIKPGEPTILVFRNGHRQEVVNYAIMDQTVYVFDKRTQKIALADLDVPATIKANDDVGMSFSIPAQRGEPSRVLEIQPKSAPQQNSKPTPNVASIAP
jgi:hypothetical protein